MFHYHRTMSTYPPSSQSDVYLPLRVLVATDSTFKCGPCKQHHKLFLSQIAEYLFNKRAYAVTFDVADGRSFSRGWDLPDTSVYDVVIVVSACNHLTKGWGQVISEQGWENHKRQLTFNDLAKAGKALMQSRLGGGIVFIGQASDWPYLYGCGAAAMERYNDMVIESEDFCKSNNILCTFMSPSELPCEYFAGLECDRLRLYDDCHFDASAVVPLQRFLETLIYNFVKKHQEQETVCA